jgi:PAS domain S-box-containing protein
MTARDRSPEQMLREANERFELAASAIQGLIYDRRLHDKTVTWTAGVTEMFGYPLQEVESTIRWWLERVHPEDLPRLRARFKTALASEDGVVAEYRFRARDGEYRDVWDRCRIVRDGTGRAVRLVGTTWW